MIGVIGAIAGGGGGDDDDGDAGGSVTESSATATTTATDATEPPATTSATDVTEPSATTTGIDVTELPAPTTATDVTELPATSVGGDGNVVEVAELGVPFEAPEGWTVVDPEDVGDLADESVLADLAERTGVSGEALQNTITDQLEGFVFSGESDGNIAPNINVIGLAVDELPPGIVWRPTSRSSARRTSPSNPSTPAATTGSPSATNLRSLRHDSSFALEASASRWTHVDQGLEIPAPRGAM